MPRRGRPPSSPPPRRAKGDGSLYHDDKRDRWIGEATVHGRRRRVSDPVRQVAAAKLRDLIAADAEPDHAATVAELAAEWSAAYERTGKRGITTVSVRLDRIRRHIIDDRRIADRPAAELRPRDVERWLHAKIAAGWTAPNGQTRDYSAATITSIRGDLSQIMAWAVTRRMIPWNPVAAAEVEKVPAGDPKRTLTADQANLLVAVCLDTPRWGAFALTCLLLGVRPGEAAGLQWARIDHDAGTVRIDTAMKRRNGGAPVELGTVKGTRSRTLAVPPLLLAELRTVHTTNLEHRLMLGRRWPKQWDGLLFVLDDGHPPNSSTLRRNLRVIARTAELDVDDLTVYELRHSYASIMDEAGVPVRDITDALGHRDDRMFFAHYRHRPDPVVRAGAAAWGRLVSDQAK